jgi:hypothetical protein
MRPTICINPNFFVEFHWEGRKNERKKNLPGQEMDVSSDSIRVGRP